MHVIKQIIVSWLKHNVDSHTRVGLLSNTNQSALRGLIFSNIFHNDVPIVTFGIWHEAFWEHSKDCGVRITHDHSKPDIMVFRGLGMFV